MTEKTSNLDSRCVLLVPKDRADTAGQLAQKHELNASIEYEPPLAMAELCLLHQQCKSESTWGKSTTTLHLLLVHAKKLPHLDKMLVAIKKYLPHTIVSELRDGRIENIENLGKVVDTLEESKIGNSDDVDEDELSMLLDQTPHEANE
ncbi:MAG: hypothetical protein VX436_01465 [Planctomycetota bacterium]|nr:hypothetical protein [Planctomycetota bacterium]